MGRISNKKLEELEAMLKEKQHVELVIIDDKTQEVIRTVEAKKKANLRLLIRI